MWILILVWSIQQVVKHSKHVLEKSDKMFSATLGPVDIVKDTNSDYSYKSWRVTRGVVTEYSGPRVMWAP